MSNSDNKKDNNLDAIFNAWIKEDKDSFRKLVRKALCKGVSKDFILTYLQQCLNPTNSIDEEFEQWAYMFVMTKGWNEFTPSLTCCH